MNPGQWKSACTEVFDRIMTDRGLEEHLKSSGGQPALRAACTANLEHFLGWQQPKLKARIDELLGASGKGDKGKGKPGKSTKGPTLAPTKGTGKGKTESQSAKGNAGKGWNKEKAASNWKENDKSSWKDKQTKPSWKDKTRKIWGKKTLEKTGANAIQVKWQAPPDTNVASSSSKDGVAAMSAGPPPAVPVRGPTGRGRGTSMPAWMTAGVGQAATASIDQAPRIDVEGPDPTQEDLLASTFAERDVGAVKNLKAKKGSGKGRKKFERGGVKKGGGAKRGGGGGGGWSNAGGGGGWKAKQGWKAGQGGKKW